MTIPRDYHRKRLQGWSALQAYRYAKVRARFIDNDNLRLVAEQDWDASELYDDCETKAERDYLDRQGVWAVSSQFRAEDGCWLTADAIGWIVGDIDDSEYIIDLMSLAIAALDEYHTQQAETYRNTYAGV